mmetsp:Transcript_4009/g.11816  ORF Transcript_4009/g.11816 Transcript_4009/m.11816 type:complete len:894 (-) Transcript_4009:27-2708(-)
MVQFGRRFQTSQTRRWQRHNADYARLKLLLDLACAAREREQRGPCGARNFEGAEHLLVLPEAGQFTAPEGTLAAGLQENERRALATLWAKNRAGANTLPSKASSLSNLQEFAFGSTHTPPRESDDDDGWHWTRWLFASKLPQGYALFAHGFDVALVAELAKVEALYARELRVLSSRWQDALADDFEEQDPEKASGAGYQAVAAGPATPRAAKRELLKRDSSDAGYVSKASVMDQATKASLKRSLAQLDADARELVDFTVWNFTAFAKITKKRDKRLPGEPRIRERFSALVKDRDGCAATSARRLLADVHARYADLFTDGDRTEAELELRETARAENEGALAFYGGQPTVATLRFGYRAGMAAILAIWVMWDCVEVVNSVHKHQNHDSVAAKAAWPLFRVAGILLTWHWLWGVSLWVWNRFRVNAPFLFDVVDTASTPAAAAVDVFDEAILETNVLLALLLCYYKSTYRGGMPKFVEEHARVTQLLPEIVPLLLLAFLVKCLIWPWDRRKQLWRILSRIVRAPFAEIRFVDTYVADVLTSMVKVLLDLAWCATFFLSGAFRYADHDKVEQTHAFWYKEILAPAVCVLPVWFRFAQCLRKYADVGASPRRWIHFWNATKYAFSLFVTLWSVIAPSLAALHRSKWVCLFILSSVYSWLWDVKKDWGLKLWALDRDDGAKLWLSRHTRMYPRAWWYRLAAVADFFGRFVWLATLVPPNAFGATVHSYIPDYLTPILALAELARRCVWGFFRLENEHISNAFAHRREGQYVPSHLRRAPVRKAPKRVLSVVETVAIAALVVALLSRMTILAEDADIAARQSAAARANHTRSHWSRVHDDRAKGSRDDHDDDTVVSHHFHHKPHAESDVVDDETDDARGRAGDDARRLSWVEEYAARVY